MFSVPELGTSILELAGSKVAILVGVIIVIKMVLSLLKSGGKSRYPKGSKGERKDRKAQREERFETKRKYDEYACTPRSQRRRDERGNQLRNG